LPGPAPQYPRDTNSTIARQSRRYRYHRHVLAICRAGRHPTKLPSQTGNLHHLLMIPYTQCPGCQGPFRRINHNKGWHQELCENRCPLDYSQFHQTSYDDNEIGYITFELQDFYVYVYFNHFGYKDVIYIYHQVFPRGESVQGPAFIIPRFEIDWNKLEQYNERWKLWSILS
jgi:hypothetical protein